MVAMNRLRMMTLLTLGLSVWVGLPSHKTLTSVGAPLLSVTSNSLVLSSQAMPGVSTALVDPMSSASIAEATQMTRARLKVGYGRLPLTFEATQSRDSQLRFVSRGYGYNVSLISTEVVIELTRPADMNHLAKPYQARAANRFLDAEALRMKLVGSNPAARVEGLDVLATKSNYFIGNEPGRWRTNIPNYSRVANRGVYPGIDIVYYGVDGNLEYDFIVAPGADPKIIALAFEGWEKVHVDTQGNLVLRTPAGELRQQKPVVYQEENGIRREVNGRYTMKNNHEFGFELADYDASRTLVIDPVLSYSTYLGGNNADQASDISVDAQGNVYVTGTASSADFPTTPASFQVVKNGPNKDVFITKLNPTGTAVIYSTYIGGAGNDEGNGIAIDADGCTYVTGSTSSTDFPVTPGAFQTRYGGGYSNPFIVKLSATGDALAYSTYVGGITSAYDSGERIAIDNQRNAYVTGATGSGKFPTTAGAFQPVFGGGENELAIAGTDAFVAKLNSSGTSLAYCTYLGGKRIDYGAGIAVDFAGSAYVCGSTTSTDFPTTSGALLRKIAGSSDAFVTKLDPTGSSLVYSTYLGGGGSSDYCFGIAVDSAGNAYVTGSAGSADFPVTPGAFKATLAGYSDVFVTKLNKSGTALVYSTYLGGSGSENGAAIAVDMFGNAYVTGATSSLDFPVVNPLQRENSSSSSYRSPDGGDTWIPMGLGPPSGLVVALAIDPVDPSRIYGAALAEGIFRSTDGGNSWKPSGKRSPVVNSLAPNVLAIDPKTPSTLYVANLYGVSKSTDSGDTWTQTSLSRTYAFVIAVDPVVRDTIYAGISFDFGGGVAKSTDGGATWNATRIPASGLSDSFITVAIDPQNTSTLYASNRVDAYKSKDGGSSWGVISALGGPVGLFVIDPRNPSTLYASTKRGLLKSLDGGVTWARTGLNTGSGYDVVIDPMNSSTVYACGYTGVLKSTDAGMSWSQTGLSNNAIFAMAVHPAAPGKLYVGGELTSDAFVVKLNATGSDLIYSTYLGGLNDERGAGIAVDSSGSAYVAGATSSANMRTTHGVLQSTFSGVQNAFIVKISADVPKIIGASVSGSKLIVIGEGFDKGAVIIINGDEQRTKNDDQNPRTRLIGNKASKRIAPGQTVALQVRNSDGTQSPPFLFTRSPSDAQQWQSLRRRDVSGMSHSSSAVGGYVTPTFPIHRRLTDNQLLEAT